MQYIIYSALLITLVIEVFLTGTIAGFFHKKVEAKQILIFLLAPSLVVAFVFVLGLVAGYYLISLFGSSSYWFAASVLFLLALKQVYDGIKFSKTKRAINPLNSQGLATITTLISLNALFLGIAVGLLSLPINFGLFAYVALAVVNVSGYLIGFKLNKLFARRIELFSALVYFLCALSIIIN